MVSLNRGLIKNEESTQSVKECPKYVEELKKYQEKAIEAAQRETAKIQDSKVMQAMSEANGVVKSFEVGALVMAFRHGGSKLDLKWKGPFKVVQRVQGNIYQCEDLRTAKLLQFDVSSYGYSFARLVLIPCR